MAVDYSLLRQAMAQQIEISQRKGEAIASIGYSVGDAARTAILAAAGVPGDQPLISGLISHAKGKRLEQEAQEADRALQEARDVYELTPTDANKNAVEAAEQRAQTAWAESDSFDWPARDHRYESRRRRVINKRLDLQEAQLDYAASGQQEEDYTEAIGNLTQGKDPPAEVLVRLGRDPNSMLALKALLDYHSSARDIRNNFRLDALIRSLRLHHLDSEDAITTQGYFELRREDVPSVSRLYPDLEIIEEPLP